MALYCQPEDLGIAQSILIYLTTDPDDQAQWPDDEVIDGVLAEVDGHIDAALRQRYSLPLTDIDPVLNQIAKAIARRRLYQLRVDGPPVPLAITDAADQAEASLKALRDGKSSLGQPDASPTPEPGRIKVSAPARRFDKDTLDKY